MWVRMGYLWRGKHCPCGLCGTWETRGDVLHIKTAEDPTFSMKSLVNDRTGALNEITGVGEHVRAYPTAEAEEGVERLSEECFFMVESVAPVLRREIGLSRAPASYGVRR